MMTGLVDTSVFCGTWPFRPLSIRTPKALKAHLSERGVARAWITAVEAILCPDPMQANEPLFEDVRGDDFFVPVALLDLSLATWKADARTCLEKGGARAFKLAPNYHSYELSDACTDELAQWASEANVPVCVQMRVLDERSHHPLMLTPGVDAGALAELATRHPKTRFLACAAYQADLKALIPAANVWVETSFVESGQALKNAVDVLGPERLVFGSHSPLYYFEAGAAKLDVDETDVPAEQVQAIASENAASLL